ncbi:MAG: hypothetical protein ACI9J2_001633 [Saprospiraceae bacterium]|jgi:hypothetical protein
MQKIIQLVAFIAFIAINSSTVAHNNVVVIPMAGDDIMPKPFAPLTKHAPLNDDYSEANEVVTDHITALEWQWIDDNQLYTWDQALAYCKGVSLDGKTDWRLPLARELQSIVDYGATTAPVINQAAFTDTDPSDYWSASSYANYSGDAWAVDFSNGFVFTNVKYYTYFVRCVR